MRIEEENKYPENPLTPVLGFVEAENLVESLQKFTLEDIGTSKFLDQHQTCEKLNLQAHQSAMANTEEFVLESFLTFEKIEVLIHNLIVMETWKEFVFPLLVEPLATKNSMRLYFVLYHEATLINLLEILIYHKHVVAESGDTLIDLIDYVARKLVRLCSAQDVRSIEAFETGKMENTQNASSTSAQVLEKVAAMATRSPAEELIHHSHSIEFRICMSACGIARLLCEHAETMSLSGLSRITGTHDYLLLFLPLIENPPWTRRTASGKWEKLIDFKWQSVLPINLLRLTKLEAQPWLAVFSLLAKKQFRERYHLNAFRKSQLMRVRKYINETLVDQLPVLADVQRYEIVCLSLLF